jgi:MFS family permease/CRP-like cAMP-binding protein
VAHLSDVAHPGPPSTFAVFRRRNFTLLWIAQFISTIGNGLLGVAASILIYRLTGSAMSVGFMLLAAAMPNLFVGLIAGVVVDRFDRKRIMIWANVVCALAVAAIPIMLPRGIIWLYFLVALSSAVEQFFAPAQASVLPETAPDEQLMAANAMMTISLYGAVTIGCAAGGLIASMSTLTTAFVLDALSFVLSALCIAWLNVAPLASREHTGSAGTGTLSNLRAGLAFVRRTPVLRSLVLVFGLTFVDYGLTNSLMLPFIKRAMRGTDFQYSLIEALFAVGFVAGSLIMANMADRLHAGQWIAISILGMGVFTVGLALGRQVSVVIACSTMIGLLNAPSYLGRQLLIQRTTPREIRGRVSSVFFVLRDTGLMTGMAAAGLADLLDVRLLLLITALGLVACGALSLILPGLGQRTAEWRRILDMLRAPAEGRAVLGLGRVADLSDIDRLCVHLPAMAHWTHSQRQSLAAQTRVFDVEPGTAIVRQGERTNMAYFLLRGRTVATRAADGGGDRILDFHNPGDFFGEIAALTNLLRTANVLAEQPSVVLQVPAPVLRKMASDPKINRVLLARMNERMSLLNLIASRGVTGMAQRS